MTIRTFTTDKELDLFHTRATVSDTTAALALKANISDTAASLDSKANVASPVFTGDPKAPTPTAGDNDTSIATTAFVTAAVTAAVTTAVTAHEALADPHPTYTTAAELSAAVTPKADTTAVNAALALKADLASPAFTGNPTAPTATAGDNDTSIATTAFVQAAVGSGGGGGLSTADRATLMAMMAAYG